MLLWDERSPETDRVTTLAWHWFSSVRKRPQISLDECFAGIPASRAQDAP